MAMQYHLVAMAINWTTGCVSMYHLLAIFIAATYSAVLSLSLLPTPQNKLTASSQMCLVFVRV